MGKKAETILATVALLRSEGFDIIRAKGGMLYSVHKADGRGRQIKVYSQRDVTDRAYFSLLKKRTDPNWKDIEEAFGLMAHEAGESKAQDVSIRVAERDGTHYLDLNNEKGEVVKITSAGWAVVTDAPVYFHRPTGAGELKAPKRGGSLRLLRDLLPVDDDQWHLILGWLFGALQENAAHYMLVLQGKGGTAKTTIGSMVASIIDPTEHEGQQLVDVNYKKDDMMLYAAQRWVAGWDEAKPLTSDKRGAFKSMVTGTSTVARKNYSDGDLYTAFVKRPIVLTGHNNLLDDDAVLRRAIPIWRNEPIPSDRNRGSEEVKRELKSRLPLILGALLDAVAAGLKGRTPEYRHSGDTTMRDAADWVARCMKGAGLKPACFFDALAASAQTAVQDELEQWPVFAALEAVAGGGFNSTPQSLYTLLSGHKLRDRTAGKWPGGTQVLIRQINERRDALAGRGIVVQEQRTNKERRVVIYQQKGDGSMPGTLTGTKYPKDTLTAFRIITAAPDMLVYALLESGGTELWGCCAEQAGGLLGKPVQDRMISLSKKEWGEVKAILRYSGMCQL